MAMDPTLRAQGPGQIAHRLGLRDHTRRSWEAPAPRTLAAMLGLERVRQRWALRPCVLRDDCCGRGPVVWVIPLHLPGQQALDPRLQGGLVPSTTRPGQERPGVTRQGLPAPAGAPLGRALVPQRIPRQEDRTAGRLRLRLVLLRTGSAPVAPGWGRSSPAARQARHGEATQRQAHGVNRHRAWRPTGDGAGQLRAPWPTALLGLAGRSAAVLKFLPILLRMTQDSQ